MSEGGAVVKKGSVVYLLLLQVIVSVRRHDCVDRDVSLCRLYVYVS